MAGLQCAMRPSASHLGRRVSRHAGHMAMEGPGQGAQADMRIVYRTIESGIEVKGFGHRWVPADVYKRISGTCLRTAQYSCVLLCYFLC